MHADRAPSVSICIPTHNAASVVADALRSALRQEYSPLEILVVDNQSTDETWKIVNDIGAKDARVRCLQNASNLGMAGNFNACIAAATGDAVLILCADDVLEPGCAGTLAQALKAHSKAAFAACGRIWTDPSLEPLRTIRSTVEVHEVEPATLLRRCFAHGNRIGEPSAVMFRRAWAARGFDERFSQAVDLEMWFHLLQFGPALLLPDLLCRIRQHPGQTTRANLSSGRIVEDKKLLFREYAPKIRPSLGLWEKLCWDARMASSAARSRSAGASIDVATIGEVFFRRHFLWCLSPLTELACNMLGFALRYK